MENIDFLSATEAAAIACYEWIGRGDERQADQAAVTAMRGALNKLDIQGTVVIGEGERDEAPMLYIGEEVGRPGGRLKVDIALDPLEGTTVCTKANLGSMSVLASGDKDKFLHSPDVYMNKIAVGPKAKDAIDIRKSVRENVHNVADALEKDMREMTVVVLDRPRHEELISNLRELGVRVKLIGDIDVAATIETCLEDSPVDLLLGIGGAPEGVLGAAALKCLGGNFQGILHFGNNERQKERAKRMGVEDLDKIYTMEELVAGDIVFCATGVTDGSLFQGVKDLGTKYRTQSLVLRSKTGTIAKITHDHPKERFK
ncbi:MAG: class II fructose-bisphosphatase [Deltaproteobacteria bacterium]|nr:class II fructose-bisphosphatase [Deltaproteobacteria bacterium]